MNATARLDQYLESFRKRLRTLSLLRGAAIVALVLLVVAAVGAWFAVESGFAPTTINVFRILLVLALAGAVLLALVDPLRRLREHLAGDVEKRVPDFDGRITTYAQLKQQQNPFTDLLAEDALRISESHPVAAQVPQAELNKAGVVLGAALVLLLYLLIAGPNLLNFSLRNLLAGWAVDGLLPPQSITVVPGDQSVRRGANLRITSTMSGFEPDDAVMHIRGADGNWQEVAMVQSPLGFEFTFFSMQNNMQYYVSAAGIRSPEYGVNVVDVPGIQSLSLTYNFPEWTEREPETASGGDIRALPETGIDLVATTTAPLSGGALVLNDSAQTMTLNGNEASASFQVLQEGQYYIAALVGGEQVRISDDFFIRLTEDGKPEIEVRRPGGDYNASGIEEVLTRVKATDDYGLTKVALNYSVNGGDWQVVDLSQEHVRELTAEHLFMLEEMTTVVTRATEANVGQFEVTLDEQDAAQDAPAAERVPLLPGDIISYYAEAADRGQTVRTDMFFIQVQPYNRRYSQSQLSGGGGGGGGQQQDEISQRQRQIIVSTWNLVREQGEGRDEAQIAINSKLLSDLQSTLAEQAKTLADRARARQLARDEQIEDFVNNMEQAVQSMYPASEKLAATDLNAALQPAQEALQHLLRAESVFNDITISRQQGGGGGAGRAGQDLAEMFELEMDLSLNQYETGNNNVSPQQQQQQAEDLMKQLDELARRQQQLADNLRNQNQLSEAQRYQQEMLRREAEKLQEQLQQLQQQRLSRNNQGQQNQQTAGAQGQQGQEGQQGQQGQPGQQGQGDASGQSLAGGESGTEQQDNPQVAQSELERRLESARRAMQQASEGLQGNLSPEEMQRAAEEAARQLEQARDQVAQDQLAGLQQTFDNLANAGQNMLRDQQRMEQQLQNAMEKAVSERESGEDPNSRGMSLQEERDLADAKEALAAQLQSVQQQMLNAMQSFNQQAPQASTELQRANENLTQAELQQAITDAALYIDAGYGLYIAGNESAVTSGLQNLSQALERAQQLAQGANAPGNSDLDRARAQAQALRSQLQQLAQGGDPNQQGQNQNGQQQGPNGDPNQQNGQQQAQNGQQQGQNGQQQGQGGQGQQQAQAGGAQQGGANGGRFSGFGPRGGGPWNGTDDFFNGPIQLPDNFFDNVGNLTQTARDAIEQMDLSNDELARMYDLIRQLEFQQTNRNADILAQEYGQMLALIEQLEVGLRLDEQKGKSNVRTATGEAVPDEYRDSVAEYFRRLSRDQ